jgi:hypothetical protein
MPHIPDNRAFIYAGHRKNYHQQEITRLEIGMASMRLRRVLRDDQSSNSCASSYSGGSVADTPDRNH